MNGNDNKIIQLYTKRPHNIYSEKSGKKSIYSLPARLLFGFFGKLKSYYIFAKNTRILENMFSVFLILTLFTCVYFMMLLFCAFDDTCSSIYMGGL